MSLANQLMMDSIESQGVRIKALEDWIQKLNTRQVLHETLVNDLQLSLLQKTVVICELKEKLETHTRAPSELVHRMEAGRLGFASCSECGATADLHGMFWHQVGCSKFKA